MNLTFLGNGVKCVLFDLDRTLVTTGGAGNRALEKAFQNVCGIGNAMDGIDPSGKTDPAIIREIFLRRGNRNCTDAEMASIQEKYLNFLPDECDRSAGYQVMDGIPGILSSLQKKGVIVGLGTGNLEKGARIKLGRSKLNSFFPFGGFGSDSENRAELLDIAYQKAQKHSGTPIHKENVFVVGDTERDILAAKKSGLKVIAAATGNADEEFLKSFGPDFFLPNFEDEKNFLEIIF